MPPPDPVWSLINEQFKCRWSYMLNGSSIEFVSPLPRYFFNGSPCLYEDLASAISSCFMHRFWKSPGALAAEPRATWDTYLTRFCCFCTTHPVKVGSIWHMIVEVTKYSAVKTWFQSCKSVMQHQRLKVHLVTDSVNCIFLNLGLMILTFQRQLTTCANTSGSHFIMLCNGPSGKSKAKLCSFCSLAFYYSCLSWYLTFGLIIVYLDENLSIDASIKLSRVNWLNHHW